MPEPLNESVRRRFRTQRVRDTAAELAIRRAAHASGLRYRVNARPVAELRVRADMVFPQPRVAVFVDGCFWHGCPEHFVQPKNNADWWATKIEANRDRDVRSRDELGTRGWRVVALWEHVPPADAVREIQRAVASPRLDVHK